MERVPYAIKIHKITCYYLFSFKKVGRWFFMEFTLFSVEENLVEGDFQKTLEALKKLRLHVVKEEQYIHEQIKNVLNKHQIRYYHEYYLGPQNRVDFLTSGGTAIEVKKGRPHMNSLLNQIERYLSFNKVKGMIVVTEKGLPLPNEINGKPVQLISLNRLWGIASL